MNPIEMLEASGLQPIIVDENTDLDRVMLRRMTNFEFIEHLIDWCPHGALVQPFIIEAIIRYAQQCAVERLPEGSFISADAWQGIGIWISQQAEKKYG